MKPVKHLLTSSNKLAKVPEVTRKKRLLNSPLSLAPKEKQTAKSVRDNFEQMVLRSPPTGDSLIRYALPVPSSRTKELIAEDELISTVTNRLKMVVSNLEEAYGHDIQNEEKPAENEELSLSVGKNLRAFLECCSQFLTQLETATKEKQNILESLFKWFQHQVNQMEEISKDQSFLETALPASDDTITLNIFQMVKQVQKLEELKNHIKQGSGSSWKSLFYKTNTDSEKPPEMTQSYENVLQSVEEFIKTHASKVNIDIPETKPRTVRSVTSQFNTMLEIFEKQSHTLERAVNEQDLLQTKCKKMESDFQMLSEEKVLLENELQKLKNAEKTKPPSARTKKTIKTERKKDRVKPEDSKGKKLLAKESKAKDLSQIQKVANDLERENMLLQEKVKQAMQEAERARNQLNYFLKEGKDFFRSEGRNKSTVELGISKVKFKDDESKYVTLEKGSREALIKDSDGQKT
ncbi:coiled-coil domain-containing protein 7-like [Talpa occidentalis]|uniref:coiled-coil domain-containing protein 7-like n=1 Tax=Talpa occidentalis TaxID=50954 RepID=UPI001890460F|nr:coiled-coil domain-containing protein 7-like [Talpa occidentalis]